MPTFPRIFTDLIEQIEFPSILLPPSINSGSIVDITVRRNHDSEAATQAAFDTLQNSIFEKYGLHTPSEPKLRCRNATQTSVVLEWDPIDLATAELRSLSLFRNGAKAGSIPRPMDITSTKISGLAIDTEYTFQLVLRTSAGTYQSEKLEVRTHKMTELSGITVTPGVLPAQLRQSLAIAVERVGGKLVDTVRIDTTHFVCTEGRGKEWERAVEMNIPVVRPEWIEGCEREGRIVGVRGYYLNADPRLRQVGQGIGMGGAPASGHAHSRSRNESQASMRPPSNLADQRRTSGTPANIATDRTGSPQTNVVPPTPPAKDENRESKSGQSVSRSASVSSVSDRGEDANGVDAIKERPRSSGTRVLVQSPMGASHKEQDLPYRAGSAAASSEDVDAPEKQVSDSGTMEDVAL